MDKDDGDFISLEDGNFSDLDDLPPEEEIVQQFKKPICSSFFSKNVPRTAESHNTKNIQQPATEHSASKESEPLANVQSEGRQLNSCGSTNTQKGNPLRRPWKHNETRFEPINSFTTRKFRSRFSKNFNQVQNNFRQCDPWLTSCEPTTNFNQYQSSNHFGTSMQLLPPFASNYSNGPVLQLPQAPTYFQNFSMNANQSFDRPWGLQSYANNPTPAFSTDATFMNQGFDFVRNSPVIQDPRKANKKIIPSLFSETVSINTPICNKRLNFVRNAPGEQYSREVMVGSKNSFSENVASKPLINNNRLDFGRNNPVRQYSKEDQGKWGNVSAPNKNIIKSSSSETVSPKTVINNKCLDFFGNTPAEQGSIGVTSDLNNLFAPPRKITPPTSPETVIKNQRLEFVDNTCNKVGLGEMEDPCINVSVPPNSNVSKHDFARSALASNPFCMVATTSVSKNSEALDINASPRESLVVSPIRSSTPIKQKQAVDADAMDVSDTEGQLSFIRRAVALPVFPELSPIKELPSPLALNMPKTPPAPVIGELPSRKSAKERLGEYITSPNKSNEEMKDVPGMGVKLLNSRKGLFVSSDENDGVLSATDVCCKMVIECCPAEKSPIAAGSRKTESPLAEKSPDAISDMVVETSSEEEKSPIANRTRQRVAIKYSEEESSPIANSSCKRVIKSFNEKKPAVANSSCKRVIKYSKEKKSAIRNGSRKRPSESSFDNKSTVVNSAHNRLNKSSEVEKLPVANRSHKRVIESSSEEKSRAANSSYKRVIESSSDEKSLVTSDSGKMIIASSFEENSPVDDKCKLCPESSSEKLRLAHDACVLNSPFVESEMSPLSDVNNFSSKRASQSASRKIEPEKSANSSLDSNGTGNQRNPLSFNVSRKLHLDSETVSATPQLSSNANRNIACDEDRTENARKIIFESPSSKSNIDEENDLGNDILLGDLDISLSSSSSPSSSSTSSSSKSSSGVSCSLLNKSRTHSPLQRDLYVSGGSSTGSSEMETVNPEKIDKVAEESGVDDRVHSDLKKGSSPILILGECEEVFDNRPGEKGIIKQSTFPQIFNFDGFDREITVNSLSSRIGNNHRSLDCQVILTNLPKDTKIIDLLRLCEGLSDPVNLMKCSETCAKIVFTNPLTASIFRAKNENAMLNGKHIKVSKSTMN